MHSSGMTRSQVLRNEVAWKQLKRENSPLQRTVMMRRAKCVTSKLQVIRQSC